MKYLYWALIVISIALVLSFSVCYPEILGGNAFLRNFIENQVLNILIVTTTVTAASASNIHLALNRIEEHYGRVIFTETRKEIKEGVVCLFLIFLFSIGFIFLKSHLDSSKISFWDSLLTGFILIFVLANFFVLIDITLTVFKIPRIPKNDESNPSSDPSNEDEPLNP